MPRVGLVAIAVLVVSPSVTQAAPITTAPAPASLEAALDKEEPTDIVDAKACGGLRLLEVSRTDLWGERYRALVVARPLPRGWATQVVSQRTDEEWAGCTVMKDRVVVWTETSVPGYAVYVHALVGGATWDLRSGTRREKESVRVEPYRNSRGDDIGVVIVVGTTREAVTWRHPFGRGERTGEVVFCGNARDLDAAHRLPRWR